MNFSQQNEQILKNFLRGVTKTRELEIRFGTFVYDRVSQKKHFESNVTIDYFYRCKKFLNNMYKEYDGKYIQSNSIDYNYEGSIRRSVNGNTETIMRKRSTKPPYNIFDYDIRLSEASETKVNKREINIDWDKYNFMRMKNRHSFIFDFGRFDLTIVNQGTSKNDLKLKYEIEFEVYTNNYNLVLDFIHVFLQLKQENLNVISNYEKNGIIKQYKQNHYG